MSEDTWALIILGAVAVGYVGMTCVLVRALRRVLGPPPGKEWHEG